LPSLAATAKCVGRTDNNEQRSNAALGEATEALVQPKLTVHPLELAADARLITELVPILN
jgi:hypothetical protein